VAGPKLFTWYQQAFGAQVGSRIPVPGGKFLQIEVRVGDSVVMLADEFPEMGVHRSRFSWTPSRQG
jgi:PhnB protein